MPIYEWVLWAFILILQNFAFTFVSRARNSGSIMRHAVAGIASNGVWFVSQLLIFSQMFKIMTGAEGHTMAVFTSIYYTFFTVAGSILAHYFSLATEKGKSAVGATKKYVQITPEEWTMHKSVIDSMQIALTRAEGLAKDAYAITVGMIPDSKIAAHKDASGKVTTTGGDPILAEVLAANSR